MSRLPLFDQPKWHELEKLEAARSMLSERIKAMPPLSHKRIALEAKVRELTLKALELEKLLNETD
ncbi:MAG: hypothetical protein AAF727_06175 [Pseudomonadota bacterium]